MSLIAKATEGQGFEPIAEGVHMAVCSQLIDLGMQVNKFKEDSVQDKAMIVWEVDESYTKDDVEHNRTISKEYTMSLHDKATLKKDLQAWRGKPFTEDELKGFSIINVLNKGCQLQIMHETKNEKTYANIVSIMGMPKGVSAIPVTDPLVFNMEDKATWNTWANIPKWIQSKIQESVNYESSGFKAHVEAVGEFTPVDEEDDKDLPF